VTFDFPVGPDVEKTVIAYLQAHPDVAAACGGEANVAGDIAAPYPMLRVYRGGGVAATKLDAASITLEAWGDKQPQPAGGRREDVRTLAAVSLAALRSMAGRRDLADGVRVSWVRPLTVCQWLPDPVTAQPRYISTALVYAHA
jgi:hypothetical protein